MGQMDSAGRVVIPAGFRRQLKLEPGDQVALVLDGASVRVMSTAEAVRRAQALVQRYAGRASLAQELIADRRRDASDE